MQTSLDRPESASRAVRWLADGSTASLPITRSGRGCSTPGYELGSFLSAGTLPLPLEPRPGPCQHPPESPSILAHRPGIGQGVTQGAVIARDARKRGDLVRCWWRAGTGVRLSETIGIREARPLGSRGMGVSDARGPIKAGIPGGSLVGCVRVWSRRPSGGRGSQRDASDPGRDAGPSRPIRLLADRRRERRTRLAGSPSKQEMVPDRRAPRRAI